MSNCSICWGYGLWAIGDSAPMGPIDASDGMPTKACPECGANPNPMKVKQEVTDERDWQRDRERWLYVLESIYGGFNADYKSMVAWLDVQDTLEQALAAAENLRDSPFT